MSSLFAMELSLLPSNSNNNDDSLTTSQRVQQLTSNPNLQTILKQQVNESGYVTSAGYKAVLQQFLYNNAVGDETSCAYYNDDINCNKQPQHNIMNTAQSSIRRRPRSVSHDDASYNNNNNNAIHRGTYNPRTSRHPRSINGSSRFGSIIQSTSNMTTSTMSSMTASITASMNNSKGSLNTSCLNGSILNDSFFGGSNKRGSLSNSLGMSKRSSLNGSGYSSYPIGTSMTSSTKRSSLTSLSNFGNSTNTHGSTISSLTYSKRSTFETFTFDQQDDNSPHYSSGGEMNNLAPRKRSDVSISQEQLDMLRKERNGGGGGVRRSDIELRGSSNSRRARLKKLISVKFDPQDDDQEQDVVPAPPNNGKGRLTGRTFPKEVALPTCEVRPNNPSTSKKDDNTKAKDESSPVRRRRRNRSKDKKERKDKLLSQRQHQESLHSILSNPRDSITTNRTKSSEENDFDKSFDPQAFLNKLCEEGKSCTQGGVPSDTNKKLCDMMNKKKNVWLPWPSKKSLLRTSSSADSNDDSISLSSVMSADDDDDDDEEEETSKLFNSSSGDGEGGWLSWPDQSSSRSLGKTTAKENRRTNKKLSSDSTTQPVTTLPLSSTSSSIKSSRARAA